jgi:hypothetical protein
MKSTRNRPRMKRDLHTHTPSRVRTPSEKDQTHTWLHESVRPAHVPGRQPQAQIPMAINQRQRWNRESPQEPSETKPSRGRGKATGAHLQAAAAAAAARVPPLAPRRPAAPGVLGPRNFLKRRNPAATISGSGQMGVGRPKATGPRSVAWTAGRGCWNGGSGSADAISAEKKRIAALSEHDARLAHHGDVSDERGAERRSRRPEGALPARVVGPGRTIGDDEKIWDQQRPASRSYGFHKNY